ncbi:1-phosphofructokinase family hexose kinase [Lactobacillus sp. YT155]|uniref:1-phosphofructokinase family hexose kinase n=1 Tax=Lactobacillus sp. YT155 TaxID=3060955 RepID=UPI0026604660|nr:1-phosphofructokinase family hexose kinase [Lactobacillus sp. YT155]MDO1604920.1 1-phosphofructokinase family hexose kinase [Lactobacillus sp. YT155]
MLLTITLNPSVDNVYRLKKLQLNSLNRVSLNKYIGGKGINAGRVASILGSKVFLTGFIGGSNGRYIAEHLNDLTPKNKMTNSFQILDSETRLCTTVMHENDQQTEFNEAGEPISKKRLDSFIDFYLSTLKKNPQINVVSINGSMPPEAPSDIYCHLIKLTNELNPKIKIILDTSSNLLETTLNNIKKMNLRINYVKPNISELSTLVKKEISSMPEAIKAINSSNLKFVDNVIISMGEEGALFKINTEYYQAKIPSITTINPTGSGDATIGGLCFALDNDLNNESLIRTSMACGISNAMHSEIGFIKSEEVEYLKNKITISKIK